MTLPSTQYTVTPGGAPMASLVVARRSAALNRDMTATPGLCRVIVGYNSSSAGTSKGKVNEGGTGPTGVAGVCAFGSADETPTAAIGCVETGGLIICSLTLNVTAAVTITPSQVSNAEPSSRQTKHPTVAWSPYELDKGSTGLHHCPAAKICPVVQSPTLPCQAPTRLLYERAKSC